jgi:hypothetical protein
MARVIKLKESDITNIVRKILREGGTKPGNSTYPKPTKGKGGSKKKPTSVKDLKKLTSSEFKKVAKEFGLDKSMDGLQKGYTKMFNMSPEWAQKVSVTPAELKARIAGTPPDTDPEPAMFLMPFLAIFSWAIAAWCFATWLGWEYSDSRLKENISRTGVSKSGIPIYTFNYKNDNTLWSGTMAQDLLEMGMEDAVKTMDNGYYAVNYNMIDVDMTSL